MNRSAQCSDRHGSEQRIAGAAHFAALPPPTVVAASATSVPVDSIRSHAPSSPMQGKKMGVNEKVWATGGSRYAAAALHPALNVVCMPAGAPLLSRSAVCLCTRPCRSKRPGTGSRGPRRRRQQQRRRPRCGAGRCLGPWLWGRGQASPCEAVPGSQQGAWSRCRSASLAMLNVGTTTGMPQDDQYWDQHSNPKAKRDVKREEQAGAGRAACGRAHPRFSLVCRPVGAFPCASLLCPALDPCSSSPRVACLAVQERQREEAAKKKAEAKRLAAEEEAALAAAAKKKTTKPQATKVRAVVHLRVAAAT